MTTSGRVSAVKVFTLAEKRALFLKRAVVNTPRVPSKIHELFAKVFHAD
jgi:hypothetical protein